MAKLFIVRHGQASFGTQNYDCLSDLGRQQSRWLGEYFTDRGMTFRRVVAGTLARQQDTAREVLAGMELAADGISTHAGLNENDGESLYSTYTGRSDQHVHQKSDFRDYWRTYRAAYEAWIDETLHGTSETWPAFKNRIRDALDYAYADTNRDDNVMTVTSGGVIGCIVSQILGTPGRTAIELNFQIRNAAFCEVVVGRSAMRLVSYNSIPHIDQPERRHAVTHV